MAGKKNKRPGRREHLNDFRAELNGEYIYEGAYYVPVSGSLADFCKKTRILTAIAVLLGFCPGFIIGVPDANGLHLMLPWIAQLITAVTLISSAMKLKAEDKGLRGYRYRKSVEVYPVRLLTLAIFAAVELVCAAVHIFTSGGGPLAPLLLALVSALCAACTLYLRKRIMSLGWKKSE